MIKGRIISRKAISQTCLDEAESRTGTQVESDDDRFDDDDDEDDD